MPVDNSDGDPTYLSPIGWWPGKDRVVSTVRRSLIRPEHPPLVRGETRYAAWVHRSQQWARQIGDYLYGGSADAGPDRRVYFWNPPITPDPDGDPEHPEQLVDEHWTTEPYSWPNILTDLQIIVDRSQLQQTGSAGLTLRAAVDRGLWLDGLSYPTRTHIATYASATAPGPGQVAANPPMPSPINGDYYGIPIRIPACLHPDVYLLSRASDDAVIHDATPDAAADRQGNVLFYPATNHQTWQSHISAIEVKEDNGLYQRTIVRRIPPNLPPPSYTS